MVKCDLKIVSINVRGLNDVKKRTSVFQFANKEKCDILFLQETYSSEIAENRWTQEWGGVGYFAHGTKHSCGVAILIRKGLGVDIEDICIDRQGRYVLLNIKLDNNTFTLINLYSPNKESEKVIFFTKLAQIMESKGVNAASNIIIGGDWNVVLTAKDKMGGNIYTKSKAAEEIYRIKETFNLLDIWRIRNEDVMRYTWRQKRPRIHCRLDYWLVSHHITELVIDSKILPSVISDHSPITLCLSFIEEPELGCGHWKLNVSLLKDKTYVNDMKENITRWKEKYKALKDPNLQWDLLKYEIRKFSIAFSKRKRRNTRNRKDRLEKDLAHLESLEYRNIEDIYQQIDKTKVELNKIYEEESQGIIVRSRAQWVEEGEKSTAYFFNLEKTNCIKKNIKKLKHNGKEILNQEMILKTIENYYTALYKEDKIEIEHNLFEQPQIPKLDLFEKNKCEGLVSLDECSNILVKIAKNKTPGNDGLPIEFYIEFWQEVGQTMIDSFNHSFHKGSLTTSQRQAVITLIDKPGKDRILLDNWRPISLLNVDYKILTKCLTIRMQNVVSKLVHKSQSGFIKDRSIFDCLRTILDIVDERDRSQADGLLLAIDFEKAFDSLSWHYMFNTLKSFNFGADFIQWVRLCYSDIYSCVVNYKHSTPYFKVNRGVRQGDSLSPYLFILGAELMSIYIRNNNDIQGLKYGSEEIKILSYADDTTALLRDESDAEKLLQFLKRFEKYSGLKINKHKTEGLWLGNKKFSNFKPLGIKWSSVIKILGIFISYDKDVVIQKNFHDKLIKIERKLNMWKNRNLTIYGKTLILKSFALSQILYISTVLHIPDKIIRKVDDMMFRFLWNSNTHKVKKNVIVQDYCNGGCKMIDLLERLRVQKIKWIKWYYEKDDVYWKATMEKCIPVENVDIFLKSNFMLPQKSHISEFYYEILKTWREIKYSKIDSKEDVLNQYLFYNRHIKIENKTLYVKTFVDHNIIQIKDIMYYDGRVKLFSEINVNPSYLMMYLGLINAIPWDWKTKLRDEGNTILNLDRECYIHIQGNTIGIRQVKYKEIYNELVVKKLCKSKACLKYSEYFEISEEEWKDFFMLPHKAGVTNKEKEAQFKIIHGYVATNHLLYKMNFVTSPRCNFCFLYHQNINHLLFECMEVKNFWFGVRKWLLETFDIDVTFCLRSILLGLPEELYFTNRIVLYGKYYILKCKYQDKSPCIDSFLTYVAMCEDI